MSKFDCFYFGVLVGVLLITIILGILRLKTISPMDVYQGKTTLKYEVVDGVKVDSTVVWKDDLRNK